jgi:hypothetical protein
MTPTRARSPIEQALGEGLRGRTLGGSGSMWAFVVTNGTTLVLTFPRPQ